MDGHVSEEATLFKYNRGPVHKDGVHPRRLSTSCGEFAAEMLPVPRGQRLPEGRPGTHRPGPGVGGWIRFTPNCKCGRCRKIKLVQIVKFEVDSNGIYVPYQWKDSSRGKKSICNEIRTDADQDTGVEGGYHVDVPAWRCIDKQTGAPIPCGEYFRDHIPDFSQDGDTEAKDTAASLWDYAGYPWYAGKARWAFETCAVCRDTRKVLGCLTWGFSIDSGKVTLVESASHDVQSPTYDAALDRFNKCFNRQDN